MPPTPAAPGGSASGPPCALHLRARPAPLRAHLAPRLRLCCSWCGRASPAPEPGPRSCRLPGAGAGRAPGPPRAPPPAPRHLGAPPPAPQPAPTRERRPSLRRGPQALAQGKLRQADGATWGALLAGEGPRALPSPPGLPPPARPAPSRCLIAWLFFLPPPRALTRPAPAFPRFGPFIHPHVRPSTSHPAFRPSDHPPIHPHPPISAPRPILQRPPAVLKERFSSAGLSLALGTQTDHLVLRRLICKWQGASPGLGAGSARGWSRCSR